MAKIIEDIGYVKDGNSVRYETRLVALDFIQSYEIDYDEIFPPVICYNTLYIFLPIATKNDRKIY